MIGLKSYKTMSFKHRRKDIKNIKNIKAIRSEEQEKFISTAELRKDIKKKEKWVIEKLDTEQSNEIVVSSQDEGE